MSLLECAPRFGFDSEIALPSTQYVHIRPQHARARAASGCSDDVRPNTKMTPNRTKLPDSERKSGSKGGLRDRGARSPRPLRGGGLWEMRLPTSGSFERIELLDGLAQ